MARKVRKPNDDECRAFMQQARRHARDIRFAVQAVERCRSAAIQIPIPMTLTGFTDRKWLAVMHRTTRL
jgi:hypothetical protein